MGFPNASPGRTSALTTPRPCLIFPYSHERQKHPVPGPELGNRQVRAPEDPRLEALPGGRGLAPRALRPPPAPGDGGQAVPVQARGLPDGRLGLPGPHPGHRHSLLPGRSPPGPPRGGADRGGRRSADDHDAPPARGRARRQLRLPPLATPELGRDLRAVHQALPGLLPAGPDEPPLCPAHRRLSLRPDLRPETPRRGFRRNVRRLADARVLVASALPELAGHQEAPLRRSADEGRPEGVSPKAAAPAASSRSTG